MRNAQIIHPQQFLSGAPSARLLMNSGWNMNVLRPNADISANATLRKDEWKSLDDAVVEMAVRELGALDDLRSHGLTRSLGSLGVLYDEYEKVSDVDDAEQSMTGVAQGQRDLADWELSTVPIPITFRDFQLNLRHLEASRRGNSAIDTTNAAKSARKVAVKLEDMLFNGSTVAIGGNTIYGYVNHPNRITGSLTANWGTATTSVIADVLSALADAEAQNYRGPFMLYIPVAYMSEIRADYSATKGDRTFIERILAIDPIVGIRGTASLTGDVFLLVQMTSDVVDLSVAQDITTVQWGEMGGFIENYKVFSAMAPRVKIPHSDQTYTGIVHYT